MMTVDLLKWAAIHAPDKVDELINSIYSHNETHKSSPFSDQFDGIFTDIEEEKEDWLEEINRMALEMERRNDNDDDMPEAL